MAVPVFSVNIDDTSPTLEYSPFSDTFGTANLTAGWNPYYTESGFSTDTGSTSSGSGVTNIGNGTSLHLTAHNGAQFAVKWNGTAITLHGTVAAPSSSALTYSISLDGNATTNFFSSLSSPASVDTAATDVLATFSNLSGGTHELILTVHNNGTSTNDTDIGSVVAIDRALIFMDGIELQTTTSTTASSSTQSLTITSIPDDAIAYRGQWSYDASGLLPTSPDDAFHTSTNVGDSAYLEFNGTAVTLLGLTTPSSGTYNITLDGVAYPPFSARASFTSSTPTVLFYAAGLDGSVPHSLNIVNAGPADGEDGEGTFFTILAGGINVTMAEGESSTSNTSHSLSNGTIAAIAVGSTLAFILVVVLIAILIIWRRRLARRKQGFIVNPRMRRWRASWRGWMTGSSEHVADASRVEKRDAESGRVGEMGVLEIGRDALHEKDEDFDGDEPANAERRRFKGKGPARSRHVSQNSDGSFSIELPELSSSPLELPAASFPSTPQPLSLRSQISGGNRLTSSTSPRSPRPRGPREMHNRPGSRGILLSQIYSPTSDPDEEGAMPPQLRVEFAPEGERPERRTERYMSTGGWSLPQSLKQALARSSEAEGSGGGNAEAGPSRPSTFLSFLDFSSSSSSSSRARRSASNSRSNSIRSKRSSKSRRNTGSEQSAKDNNAPTTISERRTSLGLSMTMVGGPTASRPSLEPNISLQTVSITPPATTPSPHPHDVEAPDRPRHVSIATTTSVAIPLPSPTDSIPMTVSDIHFRHSVHSSASQISESRRNSAMRSSGSHRPPHPPLPTSPSSPTLPSTIPSSLHARGDSQTRPYIVQKLMGLPVSESYPGTPVLGSTPGAGTSTSAAEQSRPGTSGGGRGTPVTPPPAAQAQGRPQPASPGSLSFSSLGHKSTGSFGFSFGSLRSRQ